jgi:hypothetical protein
MTTQPAATPVPPAFAELLARIEQGSAIVGIFGLGCRASVGQGGIRKKPLPYRRIRYR